MGGAIATIGFFTCIGAFIDFVLGKNGQKWLRDRLETWWLKMSYVQWGNFGQAEASFAASFIARLFGRFLSTRRLSIIAIVWVLAMITLVLWPLAYTGETQDGSEMLGHAVAILFSLLHYSISISITVYLASKMSSFLDGKKYLNILGFLFLLVFQYLFLCISVNASITSVAVFRFLFAKFIYGRGVQFEMTMQGLYFLGTSLVDPRTYDIRNYIGNFYFAWNLPYTYSGLDLGLDKPQASFIGLRIGSNLVLLELFLSSVVGLMRFAISFVFLLSFLAKPGKELIMTVFSRVIESEKPVFTLVMGGIAAIFSTANGLITAFL